MRNLRLLDLYRLMSGPIIERYGWAGGVTHEYFRRVYGPSLAEGSKPFRHEFGSDEFLLEMQNRILDERKADA